MGQELFLGQPPKYVKSWILNKDMPVGGWTDIVKALETGKIASGKLEGVKFQDKDVTIGAALQTPIAYYQGTDGSLVDDSSWIVCGFNGAVPEYVKYVMNGCVRVFVKSTKSGVEAEIAENDEVYTRAWDAGKKEYAYSKIGTVANKSSDTFTYGDTSTDYGTTSIANPYSVPKTLTVALDAGGTATAEFRGYNMQLLSEHTYLDCDAAGSLAGAEAMMADSNQCTTMWFGKSQNWESSYVRQFLNGTAGALPSGYLWTDAPNYGGQSSYQTQHSFVDKVAVNPDAMLQAICPQVNRNWTAGNTIVRTVDKFWLPGCDLMKNVNNPYYQPMTDYFKDSVYGLCEEPEFNKHIRPAFKNGSLGIGSHSSCWLRSANADNAYFVADLYAGYINYDYYNYDNTSLSPACTIG